MKQFHVTAPEFNLSLSEVSPVTYLSFIDFLNDLRLYFEVSLHIHQTIDFLLYIRNLCIAESAYIRNILYRSGNLVKAADKLLFRVHFISISPSGIIIIKCDSTIFAYNHRLSFILIAVSKS